MGKRAGDQTLDDERGVAQVRAAGAEQPRASKGLVGGGGGGRRGGQGGRARGAGVRGGIFPHGAGRGSRGRDRELPGRREDIAEHVPG